MSASKKELAKVVQDDERPIERNVLASSIVEINRALRKLLNSGLNREAIVTLVVANIRPYGKGFKTRKPGKRDVIAVFNALADLEKEFLGK